MWGLGLPFPELGMCVCDWFFGAALLVRRLTCTALGFEGLGTGILLVSDGFLRRRRGGCCTYVG